MWERQALVRARVVAGDDELGQAVEAAREEFVFGRGLIDHPRSPRSRRCEADGN